MVLLWEVSDGGRSHPAEPRHPHATSLSAMSFAFLRRASPSASVPLA
jgi:hypothetical protein